LLAVTDNFWLVISAVIGALVAVAGTVLGTWLLSRLQELQRYRHAVKLVATEVADNAGEVARYERSEIGIDDLRRRVSTDLFEGVQFELAPLARRLTGRWAILMDTYRRLRKTIETGALPPSSGSLEELFEDLMEDWHMSWRQRRRLAKLQRDSK
jgi:hypothetical protein